MKKQSERLPRARGVWLQLLPLAVMFGLLWISAWHPFNLSFDTIKFWEYLVYAWVYAAAVYLLGLVVLTKYLRAWWLAAAFAWFYFLLYAVNGAFLYHLGFMLGPYFVWVARPTAGMVYLLDYIRGWVIVLAVACVACGIAATALIFRQRQSLAAARTRWLALLAALGFVAPMLRDAGWLKPTAVAAQALHASLQGAWRLDQTFSLRQLAADPIAALARAVSVYRLKPLVPRPASDLAAMSDALKAWNLPLGQRKYPPLHLKPFTRIVMFGTESLSLDFLAPYNTNLPPDLTPFYASLSNRMFLNYRCVALPTQPGLAVTFNSHPNVGGLLTSDYEDSLIKYLDAEGYDTYFLMSGPETFLNNELVFKSMGFRHVVGSQTWERDPRYAPFIQDRGLMDQKLYEIALNCLEANRGRKIFIQLMNCDTHGPVPRDDYGTLNYPPYPASLQRIADPQARAIMASIFRHDYDVGRTIQQMREHGLLDEHTLVIITADHNFPHGSAVDRIPGYPAGFYTRIPLAFISGQPLPPTDDLRQVHSQLDFAPTIVHLLGLPVPPGWWGESAFSSSQNAPAVSKLGRTLTVTPWEGGPAQTVSLDHPQTPAEKALITLFSSVYTNSPPPVVGETAAPGG